MITHVLFDFNQVLLFPKTTSVGGMAQFYRQQIAPTETILDHVKLNNEILSLLANSKIPRTHRAIISNSQTLLRDETILTKIQPVFEYIWLAAEQPYHKDQPALYTHLAKNWNTKPETIFFVDDTYRNCQAAKQAGLQTYQYQGNQDLKKALTNI